MSDNILTQKELKALLHYNPSTGVFTRIKRTSNKINVGDIAGYKNDNGYVLIGLKGIARRAHRLAWLYMTGSWPKYEIDHINHIRSDNRFINLREVTHQENAKNTPLRKDNISGVTGVYWVRDKWMARINIKPKYISLGCFADKFEAICARKSAEIKYGFHPNHR